MEKIKTAVVGCGVISKVYLDSFRDKFTVIDVVGCSDIDEEKMKETAREYHILPVKWQDMMEDTEIQMIINLTNPSVHYTLTKQALEAGKHVFSEKMLAVSFEEGRELCRIAEEKKLRLGVAPDTFLGGGIQSAANAVRRGLVGEILSGVVSLSRDYRVLGEILPHLNRKGGSVLYDMGCYYLTALCSILGPVKQVSALGRCRNPKRQGKRIGGPLFEEEYTVEEPNLITALLEFENGVLITFHLNGESIRDETFRMELYGDSGIIQLGDPNTFNGETILHKAGNSPVKLPYTHGFQGESRGLGAAEMAWAIQKGRPHRANGEMGLHVLEITHGIMESIRNRSNYSMTTSFNIPNPLPEGYIGNGFWGPSEESALLV